MPKRLSALIAVAVVALAAATVASGRSSGRTHTLNVTIKQATISVSGTPGPPVNGSEVAAGTVTGARNLGAGSVVQHVTFTSPSVFTAKFTVFYAHGTFKGTDSGSAIVNEQGSATFSGTGKVTGGTGTLRGARGSFTFTGSSPSGSTVATFKITGKYRLPH